MSFRKRLICLAGAVCTLGAGAACAQDYPVRPIQLLLGSSVGGGTDTVARMIAQSLSERLRQTMVVVNKPGRDGIIVTDIVAKAAPDGYTLLMTSSTHGINPALRALPYDTLKDFVSITQVANQQLLLVVHPSLPVKSVKELVALAKAKPGVLNYGSSTVATALPMELFKSMTDTQITHIPYRGTGAMIIDLLGGHIQVSVAGAVASIPQVKAGKLRALAIADSMRSAILPNLPTVAESGVPGYQATVWTMMLAPAKLPASRLNFLNKEVVQIVRSELFRERLLELGSDAVGSSPAEATRFIESEIEKWTKIIKTTGIKAEPG